jgi:hypothetical protein
MLIPTVCVCALELPLEASALNFRDVHELPYACVTPTVLQRKSGLSSGAARLVPTVLLVLDLRATAGVVVVVVVVPPVRAMACFRNLCIFSTAQHTFVCYSWKGKLSMKWNVVTYGQSRVA